MSVRPFPYALVALLASPALAWTMPSDPATPQSGRPAAAPAPPASAQPPVQARPGWTDAAPSTDQTVDVAKGARLVLSSQAGDVTVRAWDRDAVRVQANHGPRDRVDVQSADNTVRVRTRSSRGMGGPVDYALTVPKWMPVNLSGTYLAATIEGTSAEVNVETVGGDLTLKGGSGAVSLRSIEGEIRVEGASGKVTASTVNDSITLSGISGDVVAETVNGDIAMTASKASSLEISTVNGDVRVEGPIADTGTYRIQTHRGDIRVGLGAQANATVFVRTFRGDFSSDFPITLPDGDRRSSNRRFNFTLGSGSARVELQSFQGDIHVARGPLAARERNRGGRNRAARAPRVEFGLDAAIAAAADVQAEVAAEVQAELGDEMARLAEWVGTRLAPAPPAPPVPPAPAAMPAPLAPPAPLANPRPPKAPRAPRP